MNPCAGCGGENPSEARFCLTCGKSLPTEPAGPDPAIVSVLETRAMLALLMGIFGIICQLTAPVALVLAKGINRRRRSLGLQPSGMATGGFVLGILGTCLLLLVILGITGPLVYQAMVYVDCPDCGGTGDQVCGICGGDGRMICSLCGGDGTWQDGMWKFNCTACSKDGTASCGRYITSGGGPVIEWRVERTCGGSGEEDCDRCDGRGRIPEEPGSP